VEQNIFLNFRKNLYTDHEIEEVLWNEIVSPRGQVECFGPIIVLNAKAGGIVKVLRYCEATGAQVAELCKVGSFDGVSSNVKRWTLLRQPKSRLATEASAEVKDPGDPLSLRPKVSMLHYPIGHVVKIEAAVVDRVLEDCTKGPLIYSRASCYQITLVLSDR
jgi:hypothetical protein